MNKQPKIVLLVSQFPKLSETFILNKFLDLLERGWDAHVVCWGSRAQDWEQAKLINGLVCLHGQQKYGVDQEADSNAHTV